VFRAHPGERAVLRGGKQLRAEFFSTVKDQRVLKRIRDPKVRKLVLQLRLRERGVRDWGGFSHHGFALPVPPTPSELFVGDRRLRFAEWPEYGHAQVEEVLHPGSRRRLLWPGKKARFRYRCDQPGPRAQARGVWLEGVFGRDWAWSINQAAVWDAGTRTVRLSYPEHYPLRTEPGRFKAVNLLEQVRSPGDCHLDSARGIFYLIPPSGFEDAGADMRVSTLKVPLVDIRGASHVAFRDLVFDTGRDVAISCMDARNIEVEHCEISNFGRGGVVLQGQDLRLSACLIRDVGGTAVRLEGGDQEQLRPGGCEVVDCRIQRWGYWQKVYAPAVALKGVGHRLAGCDISEGPHVAIEVRGNDHLIEGNEIHNVVTEFQDMGAVYFNLGHEPLSRGTVIRGNLFRDIGAGQEMVHAIYLDTATAAVRVEGNGFVRIGVGGTGAAIKGNGCSHLSIRNNRFLDCAKTLELDFFLNDWAADHRPGLELAWREALARVRSYRLSHLERYPELATLLTEDPALPDSNLFEGNLVANPKVARCHKGLYTTRFGEPDLVRCRDNRELAELPENAVPASVIGPRGVVGPRISSIRGADS